MLACNFYIPCNQSYTVRKIYIPSIQTKRKTLAFSRRIPAAPWYGNCYSVGMTKLEARRHERQWNQTTLAYMARTTQSDISAFENGWRKPYPAQAKRLAEVLGLTPDELTEDAGAGVAV